MISVLVVLCVALAFACVSPRSLPVVDGLSLPPPAKAPPNKALTTSIAISDALKIRHPVASEDVSRLGEKLNLETDFFDPATGLYSEGVWHNALLGIASIEQEQQQRATSDSVSATNKSALQLAESLYRYSWDGTSFRRRAWSGTWDHARLDQNSSNPPEQANYYRASPEHRCVQHGIALVFWSKLVLQQQRAADKSATQLLSHLQKQQSNIAQNFVREFWDPKALRWNTVSQTQGGGTTGRPSASSGTPAQNVDEQQVKQPYYRAVDQVVAILACCEHLQCLTTNDGSTAINSVVEEVDRIQEIIRLTCHELSAPFSDGFGYGMVATEAKSYLGLNRNRNFWHDGWVLLALIHARDYLWPNNDRSKEQSDNHDRGQVPLMSIWKGLVELYAHTDSSFDETSFDGTVWHWPKDKKGPESNVKYSGDNALACAICRKLDINTPEADDGQFFQFVKRLQDQGGLDPLVSVADVYPQVRLHPNSELATLLVWP